MIFLNELSFVSQAVDLSDCHKLMGEIRKILEHLKPISNDVYISRTLFSREIMSGYSVKNYAYDRKINQAERLRFQILLTKNSYVETLLESELDYHECYLTETGRDVTSTSVAGAACFDGMLVSIQGAAGFQNDFIPVLYREDEKELLEKNIPNQFDLKKTRVFVKGIIERDISTFKDLWNKRNELFPSLVFCNEVESQLKTLNPSSEELKNIIRHLNIMNEYMEKILNKKISVPDYQEMGVEASVETGITLIHYGHLREFLCPDGKKRIFNWHSKLKGPNIRIHFYPPGNDVESFINGYIGRKLKTYIYRT